VKADRLPGSTDEIRDSLLRSLATHGTPGLNVEADDDFAVALVGAWAAVCADLGRWQNHLDAEAYLDTAAEPRSVRELVRLTGYEPKPAVAASTILAFTARVSDGVVETTIAAGRQVRSIPADGESQATFETTDDLVVRPGWSAISLAKQGSAPFVVTDLTGWLSIEGCQPAPKVGDGVLLRARATVGDNPPAAMLFRTVRSVERTARGASFRLRLDTTVSLRSGVELSDPEVYLLSLRSRPFGADAPRWPVASVADRERVGTRRGWVMASLQGKEWRRQNRGLPPLEVHSLAFDHLGCAYAGTDGAGVYRLAAESDTWESLGEGAEKAHVTALAIDHRNRVFAGTTSETVLVYSPDTDKWDAVGDRVQRSRHGRRRGPKRAPWPLLPVRSLVAARAYNKDLLFAGTDHGVYRWVDDHRGWRGLNPGLPDWDLDTARTSVSALAFDTTRLELYAATSQGVYRSQTLGYTWHRRNAEIGSHGPPRVVDLLLSTWDDPTRLALFAATEHGVFRSANGGRHWHDTAPIDSSSTPVQRLAVTSGQRIFTGTAHGVAGWATDLPLWHHLPVDPPADRNLETDPMDDVRCLAGNRFGHLLAAMPRGDFLEHEWPNYWIGGANHPFIDIPHSKVNIGGRKDIVAGSTIVLRNRITLDLLATTVVEVEIIDRHDFGLTSAVSRCQLLTDDPEGLRWRFPIRDTDVYAASQLITVAPERSDRVDVVRGSRIVLASDADVPPVGRLVAVSGKPARARIEQLGDLHGLSVGRKMRLGFEWLAATSTVRSGHADQATTVGTIEPRALCVLDTRCTAGLDEGVISDDLRRAIAMQVPEVGELRVIETSALFSVLLDVDRFDRYVLISEGTQGQVEAHGDHDVHQGLGLNPNRSRVTVWSIPGPLLVEGDPVTRSDGKVEWRVRSDAGRFFGLVVEPAALTFVAASPQDRWCSEVARIAAIVPDSRGNPTLVLDHPLDTAYDSTTVELNANAVEATAGASVPHEVLGSGDSAVAHQSFHLSFPHLVYTPSPAGQTSSLVVEVVRHADQIGLAQALRSGLSGLDRVQWHEVSSLLTAGPSSRVYEVRHDDDGGTTVRFGDGHHGSRLPNGYGNVVATYRTGPAVPMSLQPGQLTLLTSRPKGITSVTNPVAASGGKSAESLDLARIAAPQATRTPKRPLSIRDIAWFAQAFPGVGHASARRLQVDGKYVVHVSVGTADGSHLAPDSAVITDLDAALRRSIARPVSLHIEPVRWAMIAVAAHLVIDPDHDPATLIASASALLLSSYRTDSASFADDVSAATVLSLLHTLTGVRGAELVTFTDADDQLGREALIRAPLATWDTVTRRFSPATLVAIDRSADVRISAERMAR
jgi:hypothetical protein